MKKPSFRIGDRVVIQSNNYNNCGISKGDIGTIASFMSWLRGNYAYVSMDTSDGPSVNWLHNSYYISIDDIVHETPPTYWDPSQNKEVAYNHVDFNLFKGYPEFDGNSINTHTNTECIHEPTLYQGFTESYHFCKKCDKRLD